MESFPFGKLNLISNFGDTISVTVHLTGDFENCSHFVLGHAKRRGRPSPDHHAAARSPNCRPTRSPPNPPSSPRGWRYAPRRWGWRWGPAFRLAFAAWADMPVPPPAGALAARAPSPSAPREKNEKRTNEPMHPDIVPEIPAAAPRRAAPRLAPSRPEAQTATHRRRRPSPGHSPRRRMAWQETAPPASGQGRPRPQP